MSSTFPSPRANSPVGLGLVGCDKDRNQDLTYAEDQSFRDLTNPAPGLNESQDFTPQSKKIDREQPHPKSTNGAASASPEVTIGPSRLETTSVNTNAPDLDANHVDAASSQKPACEGPFVAPLVEEAAVGESPSKGPQVLHRIAEVRKSQGLTERTIAKRMGLDIRSYRRIECATTDITMSELLAAQKALEVPLVDLLHDTDSLSRPVEERAQMVRVMKTAAAIREAQPTGRVSRLAKMLCDQLVRLMPELEEVSGWPQFGARRGQSAVAKALAQPIDTSELR